MKVIYSRVRLAMLAAIASCYAVALPASAQSMGDTLGASRIAPPTAVQTAPAVPVSLLNSDDSAFNVTRNNVHTPFATESVNNFNLGVLFSPTKGLDLRADAWKVAVDQQFPAAAVMPDGMAVTSAPQLFIDDSNLYASMLEAPSVKGSVTPGQEAQGIDLSASYVWDSPKFGQFIISTKSTYLYDSTTPNSVLDTMVPVTENTLLPKGTDLQSSLMLTWQVGNHTASAVTHYFDSFEDLSKLNLEQLNELVGNMTTLDLQYGYNVKAGKQGQALFSVGVRNLFNARPDQLSEVRGNTNAIEQSGRVAYGTIKYQF